MDPRSQRPAGASSGVPARNVNNVQQQRMAQPQFQAQSQQFQPPQQRSLLDRLNLSKKMAGGIITGALVVVGLFAGFNWYNGSANGLIARDRYQAVFLSNGQVYFGKLTLVNDQYVKLSDIYYLEVGQNLQQTAETTEKKEGEAAVAGAQTDPRLIKLGQEIHGPEDEMILNKDQVLFWENLKQDGTLSKTIKEYVDKE